MYQVPTLEHIAEAKEVIQGAGGFGGDVLGELQWLEQEFQQD